MGMSKAAGKNVADILVEKAGLQLLRKYIYINAKK